MARIVNFDKVDAKKVSIHKAVSASYSIGDVDGQTYLQISTCGTPERQFPGKVSQVIQLDKNSAEKLIEILKQTFSL